MEEQQQPAVAVQEQEAGGATQPEVPQADEAHGQGRRGGGGGRGGGRGGRGRGGGRRARGGSDEGGAATGGSGLPPPTSKRPRREIPKDSPIIALFTSYATALDDVNDRFERLVKLSRDVTIGSKRIIFLLQRSDDRATLLKQAEADLAPILANIEKIAQELEGHEYWQYRRAFSPGLQEFIEAVSFYHYMKHGTVITRQEVEELIRSGSPNHTHFFVNDADMLLGIADLTGELMRKAIGAVNAGEVETAYAIRDMIQAIHEGFQTLPSDKISDLRSKIGVMESSVKKVENACLALCVQGVEKLALLGAPEE